MPGSFLADDIATMMDSEEFGFSATWTPLDTGVTSSAFAVIFNDGVIDIDPVTGETINTNPEIQVEKSLVSGIKKKDTITVASRNFYVLKPEESDSDDLYVIELNEIVT